MIIFLDFCLTSPPNSNSHSHSCHGKNKQIFHDFILNFLEKDKEEKQENPNTLKSYVFPPLMWTNETKGRIFYFFRMSTCCCWLNTIALILYATNTHTYKDKLMYTHTLAELHPRQEICALFSGTFWKINPKQQILPCCSSFFLARHFCFLCGLVEEDTIPGC